MAGIRIPLTNPVSGGSLGSGISANAGTQGLKATADLFGTVGNASQQAFDTQVKLQRIEQNRKLNNLKSGIKNMTAEYQNELLKNKDSTTWQPNYEERLSKFLGGQNVGELSPEAREQWDMWHGDYIAGQKLRIARDATIQGLKNAELDLNNNMRVAEDRGDFQESNRLRHESGLFTTQELEKGDLDSQKRLESWENDQLRKWHNQQLDSDPQGYLDTLTTKNEKGEYIGYENLEIEERRMMIKNAEREVMSRRNNEGNLIKDRITTGEISSPQQLQEMRDNGKINYLTDSDVSAMKKHILRSKPASDEEVANAMQMIDQLKELKGTVSDEEYMKKFRKIDQHLMGITQRGDNGWLRQRLNYHNPNYERKAGDNLLKQGKAEAMEEATKHLNILYKNGDFGAIDNGEDGNDRVINADSAKEYRAIQRDVEQWVQAQKGEVTIDKVHDYMGKMIKEKKGTIEGDAYLQSVEDNPTKPKTYFRAGGFENTIQGLDGGVLPAPPLENGNGLLPNLDAPVISPRRGKVDAEGYAVGKASTYWDTPDDDNGMTSVGIARKNAPWWTQRKIPTIALAPKTAEAMGLELPTKKGKSWNIGKSMIEVEVNGKKYKAVYAENGMYINENSKNKLVDLSEQFQEVAGIKKGSTLNNVRIKAL